MWRSARHCWALAAFEKSCCGRGVEVGRGTQVSTLGKISVGPGTILGEDCWLNNNGHDSAIRIGARCLLGRRNFLNAGASITINDYTLTGPDCMFLGSDHDWSDPMRPYITTGSTTRHDIRLGVNVWLGAGVKVMKGVSIGHGSVVGANSFVTGSIPPFALAYGVPAKVVKLYNFAEKRWVAASEQPNHAYLSEPEYLETLRKSRVYVPPEAGGGSLADR